MKTIIFSGVGKAQGKGKFTCLSRTQFFSKGTRIYTLVILKSTRTAMKM